MDFRKTKTYRNWKSHKAFWSILTVYSDHRPHYKMTKLLYSAINGDLSHGIITKIPQDYSSYAPIISPPVSVRRWNRFPAVTLINFIYTIISMTLHNILVLFPLITLPSSGERSFPFKRSLIVLNLHWAGNENRCKQNRHGSSSSSDHCEVHIWRKPCKVWIRNG